MRELVAGSVAEPRFRMLLIGVFAAAALALTVVGLYGVVSYAVEQRRREIGIRVAVGAPRTQVVSLFLRQALWLVAIGTAAGLFAGWLAGRAFASGLLQVLPFDSLVFALVPVVLILVAVAAVLLPALRAAQVDPVIALRAE